ncbi:hypothetical protein GBZ26_03935 [Azospirillum formosense]|uniref:Uncharacterized protein n=1 Tax=Azospirillum formosense TaxID=861533 RepID=A0ABX2KU83_9PROT|nr:hypothetical protein [Azospirillum formosense]MBY3755751.1 hypothetical protein [Azospirillum formosense]NUB18374.1 hypothetical protein [Azospirillum formosense]
MRCEYDTVLTLALGSAERQYDARIQYRGGRWEASIDRVEIRMGDEWVAVPWVLPLLEDSGSLYDELRAYAVGRLTDAREIARSNQ